MTGTHFLIIAITLVVAAAFLFLWKRRDQGANPSDDLG